MLAIFICSKSYLTLNVIVELYLLGNNNIQHWMLNNNDNKNISILKFDQEWFTESMLKLWSYITYSPTIVYLEVTTTFIDSFFKGHQWFNIEGIPIKNPNKYVSIFGNSQQFCHKCHNRSYGKNIISDSPFTFERMFYTKKRKQFPTFMLKFMFLYLSWVIFVGK